MVPSIYFHPFLCLAIGEILSLLCEDLGQRWNLDCSEDLGQGEILSLPCEDLGLRWNLVCSEDLGQGEIFIMNGDFGAR